MGTCPGHYGTIKSRAALIIISDQYLMELSTTLVAQKVCEGYTLNTIDKKQPCCVEPNQGCFSRHASNLSQHFKSGHACTTCGYYSGCVDLNLPAFLILMLIQDMKLMVSYKFRKENKLHVCVYP